MNNFGKIVTIFLESACIFCAIRYLLDKDWNAATSWVVLGIYWYLIRRSENEKTNVVNQAS